MDKGHTHPDDLYFETYELETTELTPAYRRDLRLQPPDLFVDESNHDWSKLSWKHIGKPYRVENYSRDRKAWEKKHGTEMSVAMQWQTFNRKVHEFFSSDLLNTQTEIKKKHLRNLLTFRIKDADKTLKKLIQLKVWAEVHQKEDALWDPRGKRAMFEGLDLWHPDILMLGAADGYDAMQLSAMYPASHAVLVDFDDFCRTDRFGEFPESYPFLGKDPQTGYWNVYNKSEFNIDFEVCDIQDLKYGKEFDIVISSGLIEHYPDKLKPVIFHFHRQFLKPGGYVIMTSTRNDIRLRILHTVMKDLLNYSYRELMTAPQLALYAYENRFSILKCGYIKAHNYVIAKER